MALEVTVTIEDWEKGLVVETGGLALKNKEATKLSAEDQVAFEARTGQKVRDYFKGVDNVKVSGTSEVTE